MKRLISTILTVIIFAFLFPVEALAATSPSYSSINTASVTADNAKVTATIKNPSKTKLTEGGFYLGTSSGNSVNDGTKKTDKISGSWQKAKQLPCSYNFKDEYGITLEPDMTYYYTLYCMDSGGKYYYSKEQSFTTKPGASYSSLEIKSVSTDTAVITATINNPSSIKLVEAGFELSKISGACVAGGKGTDEISSAWQTASSIPCSYTFKEEYDMALDAGTPYYVTLYCKDANGKYYYSEELSFSTNGKSTENPDSSKVISSDTIEDAITWAYDALEPYKNNGYMGYCAAFASDAYQNGGSLSYALRKNTATLLGDALITNTDTNPPRGALVFWYADCDEGHVALSLGGGKVIHPWASKSAITSIDTVTNWYEGTKGLENNYRGWGAPVAGYTLATDPVYK